MTYVLEALELEDKTKNYERRHITGWFASILFYFIWFFPHFYMFQQYLKVSLANFMQLFQEIYVKH
jgi:hypothetical protein